MTCKTEYFYSMLYLTGDTNTIASNFMADLKLDKYDF